MKKPRVNPHCPVPGCQTKQRHSDDRIVQDMMVAFSTPDKLIAATRAAMEQLMASIENDLTQKRNFAWMTRLRQPEEMYFRAVYVLFIADQDERLHLFSGKTPNGISAIYSKVNKLVLQGRGALQNPTPGLTYGSFTAMETLHNAAHSSFQALLTWLSAEKFPEHLTDAPGKYLQHLGKYCGYLAHAEELFKAGRETKDVLAFFQNVHRA